MPPISLEERVAALEAQVAEMAGKRAKKDWRNTIGIFTGKPEMQELLTDAMKLREADRRKARKGARASKRGDK